MDVLTLLKSKNKCLERFLSLSQQFVAETPSADSLDMATLSQFEARREATLKAMDLFERKLSEAVSLLTPIEKTPELVAAVRAELERKEVLIHKILEVDLKIISKIEETKNQILREISSGKKNREVLSRFKSHWVPASGEGLDETL
ncbi:MAG: hypothetical protein JNL01_09350 [Bdellovibrionales bacterium]|nr:hypothetical protein [Bdellovibrionales bacterium]